MPLRKIQHEEADGQPCHRSDQSNDGAGGDEYLHQAAPRRAHRADDRDVAGFGPHQHHQRGQDVESAATSTMIDSAKNIATRSTCKASNRDAFICLPVGHNGAARSGFP